MSPLAFAAAAALGNVIGALAVVRHLRRGLRLIDACLAFGAGFMLAVTVLGVLPEVLKDSPSAALYVLVGLFRRPPRPARVHSPLPFRRRDPPGEPGGRQLGTARADAAYVLRRGGHREWIPGVGPAGRSAVLGGAAAQAAGRGDHRERDGGRWPESRPGRRCSCRTWRSNDPGRPPDRADRAACPPRAGAVRRGHAVRGRLQSGAGVPGQAGLAHRDWRSSAEPWDSSLRSCCWKAG